MVSIDLDKEREKANEVVRHLKEKGYLNDDLIKEQEVNEYNIRLKRGLILARTIEVEMMLNIFLASYFTSENHGKYREFFDLILTKDFFTFHRKIEIFDSIAYHKQQKFQDRYNDLTTFLNEVNEKRNMMAHGIKSHFTRPEILSRNKKRIMVDEGFVENFNKACDICMVALDELHEDIRNSELE